MVCFYQRFTGLYGTIGSTEPKTRFIEVKVLPLSVYKFNVSISLELSSTNKAFLCWQTFIASMKTLRASADWKISRYRLLRFFGMPECWKYSCIRRHCMKSVSIRSYSGPHFHAFRLNKDQKNSEYGHYLRSAFHLGAGPYFNQLLETQSFFNVFRRYRNGTLN